MVTWTGWAKASVRKTEALAHQRCKCPGETHRAAALGTLGALEELEKGSKMVANIK